MTSRVLMTADAVGGVWTYAIELARALAAEGLATTLATMGPRPTADQRASAADVPGLAIVSSDYQLEWMEDPWADVAAAGDWLLDLEQRVQPLAVHLNGFAHGALSWRAPVVVVGHSDVVSWSAAVGCPIDPAQLEAYRCAIAQGLRSADWVVAPSGSMLQSLQAHYGPLPRTSVIANGRDAHRFRPLDKEPIVFAAGRMWDRAKNIDAAAAAAATLSWPLVVAGDGVAREDVISVGRLSESQMASWLGRASIVTVPARYEPFGLLAVEAALSGCALVLGDIPSLREVWGATADFVDPDDVTGLHDAIERLIESPSRRAERAHAARSRALALTPARMARRYVEIYGCAAARGDLRSVSCGS